MVSIPDRRFIILILLILAMPHPQCARKGHIGKSDDPTSYQAPKHPMVAMTATNPTFIVYGDNRPGWRIVENFGAKKAWKTWKMALVPFYQIYLVGNGIVGGFNWLRHKPDGKVREGLLIRDAIYAQATESDVDFIINTGDMPNDGRRPDHWKRFVKDHRDDVPLMIEFPYLPTIGNHERANDSTHGRGNYEAVFQYPPFYSIDFPDAALFVLDSNLIVDQYQLLDDDEQDALFREWFASGDLAKPSWLENELNDCDKTFKIISIHHPPISFGKHDGNWSDPGSGRDNVAKRRELIGLFQKHGVQVVFSGHEHMYEHTLLQLTPVTQGDTDPVHLVVTGGGGAPLRGAKDAEANRALLERFADEGVDVRFLRQEQVHHFCLVEVDRSEIKIDVYEVTDDSNEPTRLLDQFSIRE